MGIKHDGGKEWETSLLFGVVSVCYGLPLYDLVLYLFLDQFVWVAARCTSAAPVYFNPYKQYIDGGVKANNPSLDALTRIHEYYKRYHKRQSYKIACLVSLGCGRFDQKRKNMDALDFIPNWRNFSWWRPYVGAQKILNSINGLLNILLIEVCTYMHTCINTYYAVIYP